jgi:heme-degrading monooxygenase HmoA
VITEQAILDVIPDKTLEFEQAFQQAQKIISSMPGYVSHELQKCIETDSRYLLLVRWQTLEDHTIGFRQSAEYLQWKTLLHHFYEPFPEVEHYQSLILNSLK